MSLIAHLRGKVEERGMDGLIVDVGGVGFKVSTSASTLASISPVGELVSLHTYLQVREDDLALYGFATDEELRVFELLINVTGVGPKAALALLSALNADELAATIAHGDTERLTIVPGIGKRTAERIVVELRDKLRDYLVLAPARTSDNDDVIAALVALGYSRVEAQEAVAKTQTPPDAPVEDKVRLVLAYFARR
jgi:Holliday junction DNA helicase RuvA